MLRLILDDIKDCWKIMLLMCLQFFFIFVVLFTFLFQYSVEKRMYDRALTITSSNLTIFDAFYQNSRGDINLNDLHLVEVEQDYLRTIFETGKGYSYIEIPSIYGTYRTLVAVGEVQTILGKNNVLKEIGNTSYIGNNIKDKNLSIGKHIRFYTEELDITTEIVERFAKETYLISQNRDTLLDDCIVLKLSFDDFLAMYGVNYGSDFIGNMVLIGANEEEVLHFVNKFSYYPYGVLRAKDNTETVNIAGLMNQYFIFFLLGLVSFVVSIYLMFISMEKIYLKKYDELYVAKVFGASDIFLYFRMLVVVIVTLFCSFYVAYLYGLRYFEMTFLHYFSYLFSIFLIATVYCFFLFRKVRVKYGKV